MASANGVSIDPQAKMQHTLWQLLALSDAEPARIDPLAMNLLIAKGIPRLAHLDIAAYQQTADTWAADIRRRLPAAETEFHRTPWDWKSDLRFFRLGFVCWYVDEVLGIRYREDQRVRVPTFYTDPSDLFLNGVMDTRQGTCANMPALHVALRAGGHNSVGRIGNPSYQSTCVHRLQFGPLALSWRFGWPVSLACVGSHFVCRYDDGEVIYNIEATKNGQGGFHSSPDSYYLETEKIPEKAVACGSDLRAVTPRELLGLFVGLRARHLDNVLRFYNLGRALRAGAVRTAIVGAIQTARHSRRRAISPARTRSASRPTIQRVNANTSRTPGAT